MERYIILASALSEEGHRVRLLSHSEHQPLFEKVSYGDAKFVPIQRDDHEDPDFIALMKNMNSELQQLVVHEPRLQAAMAKCDSAQFIELMRGMLEGREMCTSIVEDLSRYDADFIITGNQCEYFSSYFKKLRSISCINVSIKTVPVKQQLTKWMTLDNCMASLSLPRILSKSTNALKANKMTVNEELEQMTQLSLDLESACQDNESELVNTIVETIKLYYLENCPLRTHTHNIATTPTRNQTFATMA